MIDLDAGAWEGGLQPAATVMDGGLLKAGWPPMESAGSRGVVVLEIEDLQDPGSEVLQPDNSREWEITAITRYGMTHNL